MVTSVGPAGQAEITVFSGRLFVQVPVSVPQTPSAMFVTPNPVTLITHASVQLAVRVMDAVGVEIAGSSLTYSATPASLINVTPTGQLASVGGPGTGTVTVTTGPLRLDVPVTVNQQVPTSITVSPNPIKLAVGHSVQLTTRVLDANQIEIAGSAFTYSAAPAALITVSATGVVSSVGGPGTGTVTVQSGTLQLAVPVTVAELGHPVGTIVATTPMNGEPWGAAVSSSGVVYVVGVNNLLGRADLPSYSIQTTTLAAGVTTAVAFNHAGTQAWVPNAPGASVAIYDPATNALIGTLGGFDGDVYGVLIPPDDQTVYVGTGNNSVYAINATTRAIQWQVMAAGPVIHLAQHPTLPLLYASTPGAISEINLTTHTVRSLTASVSHAQAIAVSADGSELYIADETGGGLDVYNLNTGVTTSIALGCSGYGLVVSPDDAVIYLSCAFQGKVIAIDRVTKAVIATFTTNGGPRRLAISPDGLTLVAPNDAGWVDFIR
jgi:WD40 repeat protein